MSPPNRSGNDNDDGLGWAERIAHRRLLWLATLVEAWKGLLDHELHGTAPPEVPAYLEDSDGCSLAWETASDGTARAGVLMERREHGDPKLKAYSSSLDVAADIRRLAVCGVEHRRAGWQQYDPMAPTLQADQVRLLLWPLDSENPLERTVAVEIRASPNLDGSLRETTAAVVWTSTEATGEYPRRWREEEWLKDGPALRHGMRWTTERLLAAAHRATTLYRVENLVPGDPAN
ncbi:MAG: hypothetical protein OXG35_11370 [Acidobacteria bacterium]|nr:hypothetical protein [Acidobacteriota bacterium]